MFDVSSGCFTENNVHRQFIYSVYTDIKDRIFLILATNIISIVHNDHV